MRTLALTLATSACALALSVGLRGQQAGKPPPPNTVESPVVELEALPVPDGAPDEIRTLVKDLAGEGVLVDFARRQVEVKGAILLDKMNAGYPIEFLIVTEHGSVHEALGIVRCTPSKLNAAFLAFGLQPGRTVQFKQTDPLPPLEKIQSGEAREFEVIPPSGAVVDISVRWTDEEGVEHLHPIEDLLCYLTNGKPLPRRGFVYVGSRFQRMLLGTERQERFIADVEGNIGSIYMSGFGNCLFDPNGVEGAEDNLYDVNVEVCPPRGTKVSFVFALRDA